MKEDTLPLAFNTAHAQHFVWVLFLILISKYIYFFYIGLIVIEFNATHISLTCSCLYCYIGLGCFLLHDSKFIEIIFCIFLAISPLVGHLAFYLCLLYFIINISVMLGIGSEVWSMPDKSWNMKLFPLLFNVQCLDFLNLLS